MGDADQPGGRVAAAGDRQRDAGRAGAAAGGGRVHRIRCLLGGGSEIGALALEHAGYSARQGMVFYERLEPVDPGSAGVLGQLGGRMIRAGAAESRGCSPRPTSSSPRAGPRSMYSSASCSSAAPRSDHGRHRARHRPDPAHPHPGTRRRVRTGHPGPRPGVTDAGAARYRHPGRIAPELRSGRMDHMAERTSADPIVIEGVAGGDAAVTLRKSSPNSA